MTADTPNEPGPEYSGDVPVEGEEVDEQRARREASAEFVVDSRVGSEALLREAMDPANQSLAEALRLSFRVLQVVILVLVVLFVFSGFQTVADGQTGVQLRWGKILLRDGEAALGTGLKFSKWPYPAGEFVLFQEKDRRVDIGSTFWPSLRERTFQAAVNQATVNQQVKPGTDGSILTRGGDIAHIRLDASYDVESPEQFVRSVENRGGHVGSLDADTLVRLSLERAAVHQAAVSMLQEIVELGEVGKSEIRSHAQGLLDTVDAGIGLTAVNTPVDPSPALAIKRAYDELQESKVLADKNVEDARDEARRTLIKMAGARYHKIVELISQYEDAVELGDEAESEQKLLAVNAQLEGQDTQGEVTEILNFARSHTSLIEGTLGREAQRFRSLLDFYRKQPTLAIRRLWMETYASVLSRDDVEILMLPPGGGQLQISIAGQDFIRQIRLDQRLQTEQRDALGNFLGDDMYDRARRAKDYQDGPGRQLGRDAKSLSR